ncbi:MAG TPA: nucleotide exchange factor GrpE [Gemmataceae bacterium]|nr:nucleotide exchange factor GrpE [Gemmataceae bacterium]
MTEHKQQPYSPTNNTDAEQAAAEQVLDDLEKLRSRLQSAEQKRDEYLELAQRTRADFENYQKRMKRDLAEERRYAQAPLASDLLAAIDNLERATTAAEQAGEKGPLVQGVAMVHTQLLDILRRHGVTRVEAQGQPFDPNLHQAVMQQPNKEHPPMTVVQVLEQGYMIHDRVLRPARVIVSTAPEPTTKPD